MKGTIPADTMMRTISYYYLVTYCPASHVGELKKAAKGLREELAHKAAMKPEAYFKAALPEMCWRIAAFHQATREPDPAAVEGLLAAAAVADLSEEGAAGFQAAMAQLAAHPSRAKLSNRLHRQKGCRFCAAPCKYGYFALVSDPVFKSLLGMLTAENRKPPGERDPVGVLWGFTTRHLARVLGAEGGYARADHVGNLAYCLLMLATARSRFALPELQLQKFQTLNQGAIYRTRPEPLRAG